MNKEQEEAIEKARSNILIGNDIESSALILEKVVLDNYIIFGGRVNILHVAVRQILNFIEEYKNKGYLDVVREKVKANEELKKKDNQIEELKNRNKHLSTDITKAVNYTFELNEQIKNKDKIINEMAEQLTTPIHDKKWVIDYYERKVE